MDSEELVYSGLPEFVRSHEARLGIEGSSRKSRNFVKKFLNQHLASNRMSAKEDISNTTLPLCTPLSKRRYLHAKKLANSTGKRRSKISKKTKLIKRTSSKSAVFSRERSSPWTERAPFLIMFPLTIATQYGHDDHRLLHEQWKRYIAELIPPTSLSSAGSLNSACLKLIKAELQGSILTVKRSKCPSYVGVTGIVRQETRNMFTFVTPDHSIKCIPKRGTIFALELNDHIFTIHGNHFRYQPAERSSRSFKPKATIDL